MSIITLPATIYFGTFAISQKRFDIKDMSDSTGFVKERLMSPPRWRARISPPPVIPYDQGALWKNMILQLRGSINHLALYDVAQFVPRGTARGAMVVGVGGAAAGVNSVAITGGNPTNGTVLIGDWFQIGTGLGSQLVSATANVTLAGGAGTIQFEPPLRVGFTAGTGVTWDHPVAYYKMLTDAPGWGYTPGAFLMNGFEFDLMEQWQ